NEMLQMVNEAERERDIEHANGFRIEIVNRKPAKLEIESQHFSDKKRLPDMLALTVDAEDAARAAAFRFNAIKPAVATNVEQAFACQVGRQTLLDHFPGLARMIDRLAHHAFSLG